MTQLCGGLSNLSEKEITELHPTLVHLFNELNKNHDEFDLLVKRIVGGQRQTVAGTRYVITVETLNAKNEIQICEAEIWEKLWEDFLQIKLKCQENEYSLKTNSPKDNNKTDNKC